MAKNATLICVPIMGETIEKMAVDIQKAKLNGADLVEIRLDSLSTFNPHQDLKTFIQQHNSLPLLFTYRFHLLCLFIFGLIDVIILDNLKLY